MSLNRRSNHLLRDMVMKMRSVFILLLIVAYAGPYLSQGYVYTSRYGAVLNAWGTFACAMSNAKILLVCFVGYILLISDVPYFSAANIYEVVRSKRWTIMPVRVIALLKVTLLYFAVLFHGEKALVRFFPIRSQRIALHAIKKPPLDQKSRGDFLRK